MTKISITDRLARDFAEIDRIDPMLRACVYEFGFEIVRACQKCGVTKPNQIRDLVREIWAGARQPAQRKGGRGASALNKIDWVLIQAGCDISASKLVRILDFNGLTVVPSGATEAMVEASMVAIDGMGPLTKRMKHSIRIRAALKAGRGGLIHEVES